MSAEAPAPPQMSDEEVQASAASAARNQLDPDYTYTDD